MYRNFVDLCFIMLCALVVVLEQSVELRGLRAAPAELDEAASHAVAMDSPGVLVVGDGWFGAAGGKHGALSDALDALTGSARVIIVPEGRGVSHEVVMTAWWGAVARGFQSELGVSAERQRTP